MGKKKSFSWGIFAWLLIPGLLLLAGCSSSNSTTPAATRTFTSSNVQGHTHTVTISKSDIDNPPAAGIALTTSSSGHTHGFAMTSGQLAAVAGGSTVTIESGPTSGGSDHTHSFSVVKWY